MLQDQYTIKSNQLISSDTLMMTLVGNTSALKNPGQFVEIALPDCSLRRPFSVMNWDANEFNIMYKTVGTGTKYMSTMKCGDSLDILTGLGNGFDLSLAGDKPLLLAGGSGLSPIYGLAEQLVEKGIIPSVIMGFASIGNVVLDDALRNMGCRIFVTTEDGTCGICGVVTDAMEKQDHYSFIYCCGPMAMMKAVAQNAQSDGQFSLEARMGCGFGSCMGCSIMTNHGTKRICKDGPVFGLEDLIW